MKCDALECVVCGARFKYTHACTIEKRCPACRILYGRAGEKTKKSQHEWLPTSKKFISLYFNEREWERKAPVYSMVDIDDIVEVGSEEDPLLENEIYTDVIDMINFVVDSSLTKQEKIAISLIFGLNNVGDYSYPEVADKMNVSVERVRQLIDSAIKKLKHPKNGRLLLKTIE
jgi:DNA-binding CsgD family transcriptional regulator